MNAAWRAVAILGLGLLSRTPLRAQCAERSLRGPLAPNDAGCASGTSQNWAATPEGFSGIHRDRQRSRLPGIHASGFGKVLQQAAKRRYHRSRERHSLAVSIHSPSFGKRDHETHLQTAGGAAFVCRGIGRRVGQGRSSSNRQARGRLRVAGFPRKISFAFRFEGFEAGRPGFPRRRVPVEQIVRSAAVRTRQGI